MIFYVYLLIMKYESYHNSPVNVVRSMLYIIGSYHGSEWFNDMLIMKQEKLMNHIALSNMNVAVLDRRDLWPTTSRSRARPTATKSKPVDPSEQFVPLEISSLAQDLQNDGGDRCDGGNITRRGSRARSSWGGSSRRSRAPSSTLAPSACLPPPVRSPGARGRGEGCMWRRCERARLI